MGKAHGILIMTLLDFFSDSLIIFSVDNSLSSHTDNRKNNLLVLGEGPNDGINDNTGATEKFGNFSKLTLVR